MTTMIFLMMTLDLQLFAEAGSLVNATGSYVNAYTGVTTPFAGTNTMSPTMKTFYDTELLENARERLIFHQLAKKFPLPANKGRTIEWRKWNTLPDLDRLAEAVIPEGKKLGMTYTTVEVAQYGAYVTVSDILELHAVDDVILGATEELGAAGALTVDKLDRAVLMASGNVMFADVTKNGTFVKTPATRQELNTAIATSGNVALMTSRTIAKASTIMKKNKVDPHTGNDYVAIIHPSVSHDLRQDPAWMEAHKYAAPEEIFNGEIGRLHGIRFVESTLAPVIKPEGASQAIYMTIVLGKDAYGAIDVEGGAMQTIVKSKGEVGGPLEQFSTVGAKVETGAKILYSERVLLIETTSTFSDIDEANAEEAA